MLVLLTAVLTATATPGRRRRCRRSRWPMRRASMRRSSCRSPDPARLAVATRIAARLLPDGSYRAMMGSLMGNMQQSDDRPDDDAAGRVSCAKARRAARC